MTDINYPRASITEASIEFIFANVDSSVWEKFRIEHLDGVEEFSEWTHVLKFTAEIEDVSSMPPKSAAKTEVVGFATRSEDRSSEIQAREDRLIIFRRDPYTNWEHFVGWVLPWLDKLRESSPELELTAVASVYTNDLPVPDKSYEVSDWVRIAPPVPPALAAQIISMQSSTTIPTANGRAEVVVATRDLPERLYPGLSLKIRTEIEHDIDFEEADFPELIQELLDTLRVEKNLVFEEYITEATRIKMGA